MRRLPKSGAAPWALALVIAATVVAAGLPAAASAASVRPLNTGISNVYSNEAVAFQHVRATGSTMALSPVRWTVIAPKVRPANWNPEDPADPHYEWEFIDTWVVNAVQEGVTPVLQIRSSPKWAEGCVPNPDFESTCKPNPADLAAFTKAVVTRYSGHFQGLPRVRYWEGLNEPNLSYYFEPQWEGDKAVSPGLYRVLQNTFYAAVKSIDPSALVFAPGLAPVEHPGISIGAMRFTRQLLCMSGGKNPHATKGSCEGGVRFDIFDIHPYTTGGPTHQGAANDVEMGDLAKLQRLIAAADRDGRIKGAFKRTPLWITEFGWDSKPPDPGGLPMKIEMQWIAESLYQAWTNRVTTFMWYSLYDEEPDDRPAMYTLQTALYFWAPTVAEQQPKPAMYAFRFPFVAFRQEKGLEYWGRTPTSRGGKVVMQVRRDGGWRKVGVARADSAGIFKGFLPSGYGREKKGAIRARFAGEASPAFPMRRVGDFPQSPFG